MSTNKRIDPTIIAAVIGVMGTLCVTVIGIYANRMSLPGQPTPIPQATWTLPPPATVTNTPAPTDTVPAGEPTSTPAPDTPTPEPTFTPAPPPIGSDWANGCISVLWRPYPSTVPTTTTADNLCYQEPVNLFFAADGRLTFLVSGRFDDTQTYGMFAPLPLNGTVSIDTLLRTVQEGEVWVGVFAQPDINSQGTIIVIPSGDVRKRLLIQKTMPGQLEVQKTAAFSQDPPLYNIAFELSNGTVTTRILRDTVFNAIPVGTDQLWLFVGYQVKKGNNRIDAEFLNLTVQGQ